MQIAVILATVIKPPRRGPNPLPTDKIPVNVGDEFLYARTEMEIDWGDRDLEVNPHANGRGSVLVRSCTIGLSPHDIFPARQVFDFAEQRNGIVEVKIT